MMLRLQHTKLPQSQRGFTLVAVLILSGLASILVLSSIKDNVNHERLSGNFQKKINARLMSERGIFDAMAEAKSYQADNPTADVNELYAYIASLSPSGTGLKGMKYTLEHEIEGDELVLSSTGERFEGQSTLKVRLRVVPASGGSAPFSSAIVGCDSVDLSGSGQIDSYNSAQAPYDASSVGAEGNVTTINKDGGDVTLGGDSPIYGDISATGNVNFDSSSIIGNVHANGNVIIPDSGDIERVSGYVITRGNFEFTGGSIGGYVRAQKIGDSNTTGNISLTRAKVSNKNDVGLDVMYGGTYSYEQSQDYTSDEFNTNPYVPKVKESGDSKDTTDPATNCDYLDIAKEVTNITGDDGLNDNSLPKFNGTSNGDHSFEYTAAGIKGREIRNGELIKLIANIAPVNAQVFGKSTSVVKLSKFSLNNTMDVNGGDLTLFVDGNFSMAGSALMTIAAGSSLTLIVTGKVILAGSAKITTDAQSLTQSGLAPFRIYSSYNGKDTGIRLSGATDMYAQIYAPLAKVDISGSGELFGAVRGKTVAVTGGAKIHYDAALGASSQGISSSGQQAALQFAGFKYQLCKLNAVYLLCLLNYCLVTIQRKVIIHP